MQAPPGFEHVPPHILAQMANMKPFTVLIYYKGPNYDGADTQRIIQAEHLPYLFDLREKGIVLLSMPVQDASNIAAVGVYNLVDKAEVEAHVNNDPAVQKGLFTYEIVSAAGMVGDSLK